jgi:type IV pilus assembly protein PilF
MTNRVRIGTAALASMAWSILLLATCVVLTGCASSSTGVAARSDLVTESDQTDVRQRASKRLELAVAYLQEGKPIFALDNIKQALATDPSYIDAYNVRGLIYMKLNDPGLAEESFRRALSIDSQDSDALNNFGWFLCQQSRHVESMQNFTKVLANPRYVGRAKTLMNQGLCQLKAGYPVDAEQSLLRSFELDAGNPVTGYNLALLLFQRGDFVRSQFYLRRLNNSELANAESLWLGIKVERRLGNRDAVAQLGSQLKKRYSQSVESSALERGAFDE